MSRTGSAPGTAQEWLAFARSDLACAVKLEKDPDILPNLIAYHAHQAAEKAIEAVLVFHRIPFPKTHDLKDLIQHWTKAGQAWPIELEGVKTLNPYAFETRYPGYIHEIQPQELRHAIEIAGQVVAWAESIICPPAI